MVEFIEERGWDIYNGVVQGNEEGKYTFTGRRENTVINYIIVDIGVKDKIKRVTVGDRIDSDHHPIEVWLEGEVRRTRNRGVSRKCWRGIWDEEGEII